MEKKFALLFLTGICVHDVRNLTVGYSWTEVLSILSSGIDPVQSNGAKSRSTVYIQSPAQQRWVSFIDGLPTNCQVTKIRCALVTCPVDDVTKTNVLIQCQ